MRVAVSIPTYKRPNLLRLLIQDIAAQTVCISTLIIVDGDPSSGEVRSVLDDVRAISDWDILYVPSNHPNLAYQRFLGYLVVGDCDVLTYLDDDLRLHSRNAISKLLGPLQENPEFVAGTADIRFPKEIVGVEGVVRDRIQDSRRAPSFLVRWFGASASTAPGKMTPLGTRVPPNSSGRSYSEVEWLSGGVMVFRLRILSPDFFSEDLFALTHVRCGLGEDSFLGRRALSFGKLFIAHECGVDHPNADVPKAYPTEAFRMGVATAYSRRFLNDCYRGFSHPTFADRVSLAKGLFGGSVLAVARAVASRRRHRIAYATGYIYGALRALFVRPTAKRLTPGIDWGGDAKCAVRKVEIIR